MCAENNNEDFNSDTDDDYEIPYIPDEEMGYEERGLDEDDFVQK